MEPIIATVVHFSAWIVPLLSLWAVVALYTQRPGTQCYATQILFFGTLVLIACITLRTVSSNDSCWLVHTATLGATIVAGVMRRPSEQDTVLASDAGFYS